MVKAPTESSSTSRLSVRSTVLAPTALLFVVGGLALWAIVTTREVAVGPADRTTSADDAAFNGDLGGQFGKNSTRGGLTSPSIGGHVALSSSFATVVARATSDFSGVTVTVTEEIPQSALSGPIPVADGTEEGVFGDSATFSVGFAPRVVTSRHANEFYIFGPPYANRDRTDVTPGKVLIERWDVTPPDGAPIFSRTSASTPVGTPASFSFPSVDLVGTTYVPPNQRGEMTLKRTFVGQHDVECIAAVVDPEGRFALMLDADAGEVVRVELVPGSSHTTIASSATYPNLVGASGMHLARLGTTGEKHLMIALSSDDWLILIDADNDGVFEGATVLDHVAYKAAGLHLNTTWAENYFQYSFGVF